MAFLINSPRPKDTFSDSQEYIQGNFEAIKDSFDVNHVALTGLGGDEGKHKFVTFQTVGDVNASAPTTLVNEVAMFVRPGPITQEQELWFRRESNGEEICLTESFTYVRNPAWGFSRLSNGVILKYRQVIVLSGTNLLRVDFDRAPIFTSLYQFYGTIESNRAVETLDPNTSIEVLQNSPTQLEIIASRRDPQQGRENVLVNLVLLGAE